MPSVSGFAKSFCIKFWFYHDQNLIQFAYWGWAAGAVDSRMPQRS